MKLMKREPSPDRFFGLWYVIRQSDGYKLESHYWEENARSAAEYLTKVEQYNSYYIERLENINEKIYTR